MRLLTAWNYTFIRSTLISVHAKIIKALSQDGVFVSVLFLIDQMAFYDIC